jgi:uncharacterized protein YfeS
MRTAGPIGITFTMIIVKPATIWGLIVVLLWIAFTTSSCVHRVSDKESQIAAPDEQDAEQRSKQNASSEAQKLMKQLWFWSVTDDNSPFGNDDGADALTFFHQWRSENPKAPIEIGVIYACTRLKMPFEKWQRTSEESIQKDFGMTNVFSIEPGDRMIIGIAFGQLRDEGYVAPKLRNWGLQAIRNEKLPKICGRWRDPQERMIRLGIMESVLKSAPETK